MRQHEKMLISGITGNMPTKLKNSCDARAYFGIITDSLETRFTCCRSTGRFADRYRVLR